MGLGYRVAYVKVNIAEDYDSGVIGAQIQKLLASLF